MDNNDEQIKLAQAGNRRAFEGLLNDYYEVMFRFAFKYCGCREDAEDITQNACMKLARNIGQYKFKSAFTSWLYRLVINTAIDWQRQNKKDKTTPDLEHTIIAPGNAEKELHAREVLQQVFELPEKEKTALLLVFSEGLTHKEAAKVMDCKESTISWYIHEARKKLAHEQKKEAHHG